MHVQKLLTPYLKINGRENFGGDHLLNIAKPLFKKFSAKIKYPRTVQCCGFNIASALLKSAWV